MIFECKSDLKIYHDGHWYDRDDLSRGVGYWSKYIKSVYDSTSLAPLGVLPGINSFSSTCFLLALYETGTSFRYLNSYDDYTREDSKQYYNVQDFVMMGEPLPHQKGLPTHFAYTDSTRRGYEISQCTEKSALKIEFKNTQLIYLQTSGTTGDRKSVSYSADAEGRAIQYAMDTYFDANDICICQQGMIHKGVHTAALLPAIFSVSKIFFSDAREWSDLVKQATFANWLPIMRDWADLPPNITKVLTGATMVTPSLIDFIFEMAPNCTVYDAYGLSECLPPVAIKQCTKQSRNNAFNAGRSDIEIIIDNDNKLSILDKITGRLLPTGDLARRVDATNFEILGRDTPKVRIDGRSMGQVEVASLLSESFNQSNFSISVKEETLIIKTDQDVEPYKNWALQHLVERFEVVHVPIISTGGGVKTVG